jgi:8-amino-7-oxononanoate synthase
VSSRAALDFTSSLYLGMLHSSTALRPWAQLTTGGPAALGAPPEAHQVAAALAQLQGCERATLARSTLHAFGDLFEGLAGTGVGILVDAGAYPVARWGIARVTAQGIQGGTFAHHDPDHLRDTLGRPSWRHLRPVVVSDGHCAGCGRPAPLSAYVEVIRRRGGLLAVDDTQALGVLGAGPDEHDPYGRGGGGSLPWAGVSGPDIVVVSSLAKGFGVPMAVVSGSDADIARLERDGPSRSHSSQPSMADLHAAEHALTLNRRFGDALRARLGSLVLRFRSRMEHVGVRADGGAFPVQVLPVVDDALTRWVYRGLLERGVRTVLQRPLCRTGPHLTFLLRADQRPADIDTAARALDDAWASAPRAAGLTRKRA